MAEIRCPMCGKPNPDHLEVCQHCQARLKPLVSPPGSASDSELPDWLRDMGAEEETAPSEDEATEWLARLQGEEDQGESEPEMPAAPADRTDSAPEAEEDDWLGQIRSLDEENEETEPPPAQQATPSQPEDHPPDWLDQLSEIGDYEEGEEELDTLESRVETPADEEGDRLPEWLNDMGETEEAEPSMPESRVETPSAPEEDQFPDWLDESAQEEQEDIPESRVETPSGDEEEETPDWIREMEQADEEAEAEMGESFEAEQFPEAGDEDLPDWLSDSDEQEEALPDEQAPADADLPAWALAEEDVPSEEAPSPTPEGAQAFEDLEPSIEEEEDMPDWLTSMANETPSEPATVSEEPTPAESEDDELDWSKPIGLEQEADEESFELYDDIPDWLSGEEDEEAAEGLTKPETEEPDWLQSIGTEAQADLIPDEESLSVSPFTEDALEDEMFDSQNLADLFEADQEPVAEGGEEDSDLAPTDLPDWLQAMRPVETSEEDEPEAVGRGVAVNTGPLAGLRGVLLAEPEIAKIKKPPTFSAKLEVTREQRQHLRILEDLLASEGKASPVAKTAPVSSQRFLRWIIGLILFLVIALAVIGAGQGANLSQGALPIEVSDAYNQIESLSSGDPVMISFDYEPGMAGEMETVASGLIDHLMDKEAHLTLVSTSPTGPALASHLVDRFKETYGYASGNQFINLGYVPGGASGLLGFAKIPQRVTPLSYDGMNAWATTPLANVNTLADFNLVIVITDTPNTARAWIEQVQPRIEGVPFILATSAQAEPILRPYYGGRDAQVQGLVSGIPGGSAYEQALNKPSVASSYRNTLGFGLMTAILAIALGGAVNLVMTINKQNKPEEQRGTA